ncbi:aspartic and glutamic acid-rich protein-like [Sphaeramia orbicularis]|uniref:aspartic and glutamic acid-rich protein-like n=1 Tax=Sphaeramia orbicularis TaxID=375764 RepID=UPI00117C8E33|nr:aspartic and glutamic acid-rich protein-like [Sphaeramia orbicularis]
MSSGLHVVEVEVQRAGVCGGQMEVQKDGVCGGQVEVKAELSDGSVLLLKRTDEDLAWMMKKLVDSFPDDRETLSSRLLNALLKVRAAEQSSDPQVKVQEVNRLLNIIINLPCKVLHSTTHRQTFRKQGQNLRTEDQIQRTGDQTLRTEEQIQRTEDQTLKTEDQIQRTENQTLRTEDQIQRTEDQTLRTEDQIQRTENQTLRTEDQIQRTENQTLKTEDQTLRTEDQIQKTEDQTLTTEDQIEKTENQTFINKDQTKGADQTFRPEEDLESRVSRSLGHSEVLRSNGFCLANTETILFDLTPPTQEISQSDDATGRRPSVQPPACLQLCHPSVSPHLLRGFTGMMGRLVKRRSFKHRMNPPHSCIPST